MTSHVAFWFRARRLELLAAVACGALTWVFGGVTLPGGLADPDLPRDRVILLFAALQASCVLLSVHGDPMGLARLATVRVWPRNLLWTVLVLGVGLLAAWLGSTSADIEGLDTRHVRNVALFSACSLILAHLSRALALAAPYAWLSLSVVTGATFQSGDAAPTLAWWAYPLEPADSNSYLAWTVVLVAAGLCAVAGSALPRGRRD